MKESTQSTTFFSSKENCANPWSKGCEGTDIVIYIMKETNRLPICKSCWKKIADQDIGWSED